MLLCLAFSFVTVVSEGEQAGGRADRLSGYVEKFQVSMQLVFSSFNSVFDVRWTL